MRSHRRSPLFSAVVLAGAALTQTVDACGGETDRSGESDASTASDAKAPSTRPDAGWQPADAAPQDAGTCPDGSERPTPPCVAIK